MTDVLCSAVSGGSHLQLDAAIKKFQKHINRCTCYCLCSLTPACSSRNPPLTQLLLCSPQPTTRPNALETYPLHLAVSCCFAGAAWAACILALHGTCTQQMRAGRCNRNLWPITDAPGHTPHCKQQSHTHLPQHMLHEQKQQPGLSACMHTPTATLRLCPAPHTGSPQLIRGCVPAAGSRGRHKPAGWRVRLVSSSSLATAAAGATSALQQSCSIVSDTHTRPQHAAGWHAQRAAAARWLMRGL